MYNHLCMKMIISIIITQYLGQYFTVTDFNSEIFKI